MQAPTNLLPPHARVVPHHFDRCQSASGHHQRDFCSRLLATASRRPALQTPWTTDWHQLLADRAHYRLLSTLKGGRNGGGPPARGVICQWQPAPTMRKLLLAMSLAVAAAAAYAQGENLPAAAVAVPTVDKSVASLCGCPLPMQTSALWCRPLPAAVQPNTAPPGALAVNQTAQFVLLTVGGQRRRAWHACWSSTAWLAAHPLDIWPSQPFPACPHCRLGTPVAFRLRTLAHTCMHAPTCTCPTAGRSHHNGGA